MLISYLCVLFLNMVNCTMFEIAVFCAIVALCSAYVPVNVENEWNEIRKILIHQEKRIKELKNENRDFHADMAKPGYAC